MTNWPELARCFAVLRPVRWIDAEARALLERIDAGRPVLVACSGGADSVFLLLTTSCLFSAKRIHVAHFHHRLRGNAADQDAEFTRQLSNALGFEFHLGHRNPDSGMSEADLRVARYAWLDSCYHGIGAGALLLGHHADDLLETQLINLLTGSGPAGLSAPLPVHPFANGVVRVRPLLPMKRSTIVKTLGSLQVPWREDGSNRDSLFTRNWLRQELLPMLKEHFPQDIHAGSARTCQLQREAVEAIDAPLSSLSIDFSDPAGFYACPLQGAPAAVARRALYGWWMRHYGEQFLPTRAADKVISAIAVGDRDVSISIGRVPFSEIHAIRIDGTGYLRLARQSGTQLQGWGGGVHWHWPGGPVRLPSGASLRGDMVHWKDLATPYMDASPRTEAWLRPPSGALFVRPWLPGDRYRPLGAPGSRKLQDVFCDAKLNSEQKRVLPVILNSADDILWVPGFPPAESYRIVDGANSALRLTYRLQSTASI